MTLEEIKAAVLAGKRVFHHSPIYEVKVDFAGNWLIVCNANNYCIGLTWRDGVTMNGEEKDFYTFG